MSYSTNPVLDENRHTESQDKCAAAMARRCAYYAGVINEAFTHAIRKIPAAQINVPYVGGNGDLTQQPVIDAVTDLVTFGAPRDALMKVLAQSDCPHVQALRNAMADDYIRIWASEIAEVTA